MIKGKSLIPFLIIVSLTFFLSGSEVFERFTPRSVCMYYNTKLILLHAISDFIIFVAYCIDGLILYALYTFLRAKGFPFAQYAWWFGGFIFFCGLTHLMGVINLKITFYWVDGILKLLTAWFSILVCIALVREYPKLKQIKTPEEIKKLSDNLEKLMLEVKDLKRRTA